MFRCAFLLIVASSVSARAEIEPTAQSLFVEARALVAKQAYAEACPLFLKSHSLEPALGTLLNLADCYENAGLPASAFRAFNDAAAWAERNHESRRVEVASMRAKALKSKIFFVSVELVSPPAGAIAKIASTEGALNDVFRWPLDGALQSVPLDPGHYRLRIEAPAHESVERVFDVAPQAGSAKISVAPLKPLVLSDVPVVASADLSPPPMPAAEAPAVVARGAVSHSSAIGLVNVVVGGALLAAGVTGLVYSGGVIGRVDRQQPGQPDANAPTVTRGEFQTVQTLYPLSWATLGVGAVALGAGLILMMNEYPQSLRLNVSASDKGAGATLSGAF